MAEIQIMPGVTFSHEEKATGRINLIRWWYVKCYFSCGAGASGEFLSSSTDVIGDIHRTLKAKGWKERISDRVWECPKCGKENMFGRRMSPKVRKKMKERKEHKWSEVNFGSRRVPPAVTAGVPLSLQDH